MTYEMFWSIWIAIAVGASVALGLGVGVFLGLRWPSSRQARKKKPEANPDSTAAPLPRARNVDAVFVEPWKPLSQMSRLRWLAVNRTSQRQFTTDVTLQWTDVEGDQHEHTERCLWPDLFWELDEEQQQELMQQAAMAAVRTSAGIDVPGELP